MARFVYSLLFALLMASNASSVDFLPLAIVDWLMCGWLLFTAGYLVWVDYQNNQFDVED